MEYPDTLFQKQLAKMGACHRGRVGVGGQTARKFWATTRRPDWMFWLAEKVGVERKLIVLAACACAREALVNVPAGEYRPRYAIEMAEAWCRGEATLEQVRCASHAAYDASTAASTAAAYAAYAASASSSAASAASSAASAASAYDARTSCAHIRRVISFEILREASGR